MRPRERVYHESSRRHAQPLVTAHRRCAVPRLLMHASCCSFFSHSSLILLSFLRVSRSRFRSRDSITDNQSSYPCPRVHLSQKHPTAEQVTQRLVGHVSGTAYQRHARRLSVAGQHCATKRSFCGTGMRLQSVITANLNETWPRVISVQWITREEAPERRIICPHAHPIEARLAVVADAISAIVTVEVGSGLPAKALGGGCQLTKGVVGIAGNWIASGIDQRHHITVAVVDAVVAR